MALTITETGFDMGLGERRSWHLDEHTHAVFGTLDKLREEVMEYQEACRQRLPMVALFELSDIVGALAGHLRSSGRTRIPLVYEAVDAVMGCSAELAPAVASYCDHPSPAAANSVLSAVAAVVRTYNMTLEDMLRQAQLRSAVLLNGSPPCPG
mgnify:FL=1